MPPRDEPYISPLMKRLKDQEVLSLETLAKYVPDAQRALKASDRLANDEALTPEEIAELRRDVQRGEYATERITLISMPLIKSLAKKEHRRRESWNTRVSLEDIVSEGLSGLLRGIRAYDVNGAQTSPTNYLGQWITTDMRRNSEATEHDFSIPYEAMERHRKIRAIRSRLSGELGREPTDQEIVDAAADTSYTDGNMMGRVNKQRSTSNRRALTVKHVEEERRLRTRTGVMSSTTVTDSGDEHSSVAEMVAFHVTDDTHDTSVDIEEAGARAAMSALIEDSFNVMQVGRVQRDVIRRRFGLTPYEDEQTIKDIVVGSGIPKYKVNRILGAYSSEMTVKNGHFHELISRMSADDIESINMGWVLSTLGQFSPPVKNLVSKDLTEILSIKQERTQVRMTQNTAGRGVIAYFQCEYHQNEFSGTYQSEADVPPTRVCPQCNRSGARVA